MNKAVMVDIDSTLVPFDISLYNEIISRGYLCTKPELWTYWDKPFEFIPDKEVQYDIIDAVHTKLIDTEPLDGAKELLLTLWDYRYYIIIASHKRHKFYDYTMEWLENNDLIFNYLHLSFNKLTLLDEFDVDLIIDDSPSTILKAINRGIRCISLKYPYNEKLNIPLFDNLRDMTKYIIEEVG